MKVKQVAEQALHATLSRYEQVPMTLYRIQPSMPVKLREYGIQRRLNRPGYDVKQRGGLVYPLDSITPYSHPNGLGFRPWGDFMKYVLEHYRGNPRIYTLPKGMLLPPELCLYLEHHDHYSLQTTRPLPLKELNDVYSEFLFGLASQSVSEFIQEHGPCTQENQSWIRHHRSPITLYRIQPAMPVQAREYSEQQLKGKPNYDVRLRGGMVYPLVHFNPRSDGPNGLKLRMFDDEMKTILQRKAYNPMIYTLHCGKALPTSLCIYREPNDEFSLQASIPCTLKQFNKRLTFFLESLPCQTAREFLSHMDDVDDQDQ